jgi:hypothetical protein
MRFASSEDFLRTVVLVLEILVLSYSAHSLYCCGLLHRQSLLVVGRACISESNRPCLLFYAFDESKNLYSFHSIIDCTFLSSLIYQMNTRSSILRLKYLHLQASPQQQSNHSTQAQLYHPSFNNLIHLTYLSQSLIPFSYLPQALHLNHDSPSPSPSA